MFHVKHVQAEQAARVRLAAMCAGVRQKLISAGLSTISGSHGPIIPIILGENEDATEAAIRLRRRGVLTYPVRPPTVPQGTARLRVTLSASLTEPQIDHLIQALIECCRKAG
jgi:7-keto-8-aminopelargonate synthetase-like enzyme